MAPEGCYPKQVTHEYAQQNALQKVSVYIPKPYSPEDEKKGFWIMCVVTSIGPLTSRLVFLLTLITATSMEEPGVTRERRWIRSSQLDPCS